jgi:hypothetical protein
MGNKDQLFEIADMQQSFFITRQAEECGFSRSNFHQIFIDSHAYEEVRQLHKSKPIFQFFCLQAFF